MNQIIIRTKLIDEGLEERLLKIENYNRNSKRFIGSYNKIKFFSEISLPDYIYLSFKKEIPELVYALTRIFNGKEPFVKYEQTNGILVFEWDKSPRLRYRTLKKIRKLKKLEKLKEF